LRRTRKNVKIDSLLRMLKCTQIYCTLKLTVAQIKSKTCLVSDIKKTPKFKMMEV
jgi:hypothetical protein